MNFSRSFAVKCVAVCLALAGCAGGDGSKEYAAGLEAYAARDLVHAEKLVARRVTCAPLDADALLTLARIKLDLGKLADAAALVKRLEPLAGGDVDVRLFAAQLAWHAKDNARARALFGALRDDASLTPAVRSQAWAGLGVVRMTMNENDLARLAFLTAIRLDRRNASAWYHLGLLYRDAFGFNEAALEQFNIFVRLDAEASPRVQKVQKKVIPDLKDLLARQAAERPGVDRRNSTAAAGMIAKAEAAAKRGGKGLKEARERYQDALAADPLCFPAALGLAQMWLKTDASRAGLSKALENYRIACVLRPSSVSTFLAAGDLASRLGYHAQAVEIYSRALAADPTSVVALDGLVTSLRRGGDKSGKAAAYQAYRALLKPVRKGTR